jgi:CheY-like chemotaxis protein
MTKVLVFESDRTFAGQLHAELSRLGAEVEVVEDANVGLQAAATHKPDLILLCIELPRMNGFSICNRLKKDTALKDIPLVIMSSESSDETFEQHRKLRTRAEEYVHKPIQAASLVERIRPLLRDLAAGEPESIALDEIEIIEGEPDGEKTVVSPPAPASVKPPGGFMGARPEEEIDTFLGGAFDHLLGQEESAQGHDARPTAPSVVTSFEDYPAGPQVNPPRSSVESLPKGREESGLFGKPGAIARVSSIPPKQPGDAVLLRHSVGAPAPGDRQVRADLERALDQLGEAHAELDRTRVELERTRTELVALTRESDVAHASENRLKSELGAMRDSQADLARLRRELDELRHAHPVPSIKPGAISSREFLDLREALNKKDKEILALRDLLSKKDKELLDLRDQVLALDREKADQVDKLLELERANADFDAAVEVLTSEKASLSRRVAELEDALAQTRSELLDANAARAAADAAHSESIKNLEAMAKTALESEREAAARALSEAVEKAESAATAASELKLAALADGHASSLETVRRAHERALEARTSAFDAEKRELATVLAARASELEQAVRDLARAQEASAQLESSLSATRADLEHAHERLAAMQVQSNQLSAELNDERAKREAVEVEVASRKAEVAALRSDLDARTAQLARAGSELDDRTRERDRLRADLAERTEERDQTARDLQARTQERDRVDQERATLEGDVRAVRGQLERVEQRTSLVETELSTRTGERDGLRAELDTRTEERDRLRTETERLSGQLAQESTRLSKARDKWDADRQALDRARLAITSALSSLDEATERGFD